MPIDPRAKCKVIVPSLSTDAAVAVDLAGTAGNWIVGFEIHNTHATDVLAWAGENVTATLAAGITVAAGESSGFIPGNDREISIIRAAGVAVTCRVLVIGR